MRMGHTTNGEAVAKQVAAEVRAEMARQRITQQALADQLGWPQSRLARRLADTTLNAPIPFDVPELVLIADALGVPLAQFLPVAVAPASTS